MPVDAGPSLGSPAVFRLLSFACFFRLFSRPPCDGPVDCNGSARRDEKSPLLDAMLRQSVKPMRWGSPQHVTPPGASALVPGPSTARLHLSSACPQSSTRPQKICAQADLRTAGERVNALLRSRAIKGRKSCSLFKHRPGSLWITPCRPATIAASFRRLGRSFSCSAENDAGMQAHGKVGWFPVGACDLRLTTRKVNKTSPGRDTTGAT